MAGDPDTHHIFTGEAAPDLEKAVSGLGDQVGHGPVLLGWMLGQLMSRGTEGLQAARQYGDTALAGGGSTEYRVQSTEYTTAVLREAFKGERY